MTETNIELDVKELQEYVTRIEAGAAIIYSLLNEVYNLHNDEEVCKQCETPSPCRTAQVILSAMVEEKPAE